MEWIIMKFEVKRTSEGKYMITGTKGYTVRMDNLFDAEKHCLYLNKKEELLDKYIQQNAEYYTTLSKIKMLTDRIHRESGELHVIELAIRIRELIRETLP